MFSPSHISTQAQVEQDSTSDCSSSGWGGRSLEAWAGLDWYKRWQELLQPPFPFRRRHLCLPWPLVLKHLPTDPLRVQLQILQLHFDCLHFDWVSSSRYTPCMTSDTIPLPADRPSWVFTVSHSKFTGLQIAREPRAGLWLHAVEALQLREDNLPPKEVSEGWGSYNRYPWSQMGL